MRTNTVIAVVGACLQAANAAPPVAAYPEMRLVKTSAQDPGQWVTEQEKFDRFTSKNIGFIDITDIKVRDIRSEQERLPRRVVADIMAGQRCSGSLIHCR